MKETDTFVRKHQHFFTSVLNKAGDPTLVVVQAHTIRTLVDGGGFVVHIMAAPRQCLARLVRN